MNDENPYQPPGRMPRQPNRRRPRSLAARILTGLFAGSLIGCAVSGLSTLIIGSTIGYMDYEFSGLGAVVFGTLGALPAAVTGVMVGMAQGPAARSRRLAAASVLGSLCSLALYVLFVVPQATLPTAVVFWMGVVPDVSGLVTGGIGALIGLGDQRLW